ncbi:GNAT family N-acetyltransferase [Streptomyces sp. NPDC048385]|uniref:GNAT family N-acetyltransferase n=1 Tax=unclassified Streptomyces TaxID=2593676 RepID=UPI00342192B3
MTELGSAAWPPAPIKTERLVLREPEARDRAAFIELLASPEVHTYLGGPRPPDELEREVPEVPGQWPGCFVVNLDGAMIGEILLRRAPGHSRPAAEGKVDLGYLFLLMRLFEFPPAAQVLGRHAHSMLTWLPHAGTGGGYTDGESGGRR